MARNDNSVNIESDKDRYHHGDLRSALIEEGLARLATGPAEALSLREIARNVGVSATAVYRHFPDKASLVAALCDVGGERLADAFRAAMSAAEPGRAAFNAMGRAYVRFALAHPALFRLMNANAAAVDESGPRASRSTGMQMMVQALNGLANPADTHRDLDLRRMRAWALVHGLAMLMLDGHIPPDDTLIDSVIDVAMVQRPESQD